MLNGVKKDNYTKILSPFHVVGIVGLYSTFPCLLEHQTQNKVCQLAGASDGWFQGENMCARFRILSLSVSQAVSPSPTAPARETQQSMLVHRGLGNMHPESVCV
jgi:hypothetical protein